MAMNVTLDNDDDLDILNANPEKLPFKNLKRFAKDNGIKLKDIYHAAGESPQVSNKFARENNGFAHHKLYYALIGLIVLRRNPKKKTILKS